MKPELIPVQIGGQGSFSTFYVELACPSSLDGCLSQSIIKHGHDTSVKDYPQHYECKICDRHFYPHTSGVFSQLKKSINDRLFSVLHDGKIDTKLLGEILGSSPATISKIMRFIIKKVATHPKTEIFWKSPMNAKAIYIDETWINISRRTWYLVVLLNEKGSVLAFDLVKKRTSSKIIELILQAERRLHHQIGILITDDFSTYKGVATGLKRDLIHVRHIHQPPYGRIVIDKIEIKQKEIITTHVATTNDIFLETNTFMVRISKSVKKIHKTGKRGRKKGSKNRAKAIIEQEKRQKKDVKGKNKKGPKNPFKHGETHVFHHDKKMGLFHPRYGSDESVAESLQELLVVFKDKHITTNPVENVFSVIKKLIDFRGRRNVEQWRLLTRYYFTVREYPEILKEIINDLDISPQMCHKSLYRLLF